MRECQQQTANKHGLGNSLVTGHKATYFTEAAFLYADLQSAPYRQALEDIVRHKPTPFGEWVDDYEILRQIASKALEQ